MQYSKPRLIIRFKYLTDHTKHAKRFEEHITQSLKSIERRSSLPAIHPPLVESLFKTGKHLRELFVKIFAKNSILDVGRVTNNTKIIFQKSKNDRKQLIRKQLILDQVNLIKRVSGGGIKTWVENFQNDGHSRI